MYYMLVSSFAGCRARFDVDRLPITLERSRHACACSSRRTPGKSAGCWTYSGGAGSSRRQRTAVAKRYGELMQEITTPLAHEVPAAGMNMRMIVAGCVAARRGLGPPTVGFGRWSNTSAATSISPISLGQVIPRLVPSIKCLSRAMCSLFTGGYCRKPDISEETFAGLRQLQFRSRRAVHRALGHHPPLAAAAARARPVDFRSARHGGHG